MSLVYCKKEKRQKTKDRKENRARMPEDPRKKAPAIEGRGAGGQTLEGSSIGPSEEDLSRERGTSRRSAKEIRCSRERFRIEKGIDDRVFVEKKKEGEGSSSPEK